MIVFELYRVEIEHKIILSAHCELQRSSSVSVTQFQMKKSPANTKLNFSAARDPSNSCTKRIDVYGHNYNASKNITFNRERDFKNKILPTQEPDRPPDDLQTIAYTPMTLARLSPIAKRD